jgi:putative transposase
MNQVTRLALVDSADAKWSIVAQCRLLKVARSSLYWRPAAASEDDLRLMRRIDELYLMTPFNGARRMVAVLRRDGWTVNRKAGATAAAPDADRGDLPAAKHQPPSSGPCCLPLSFAWSRDRSAEPGVVRQHYLHPAGERVRISDRGDGLVQPTGSGLASVDRHGNRVLCRGLAGRA